MKKPLVFQADLSADVHTELRKYPELALDCEMMGLNPWRDRLCVVQIAAEGGPLALVQIDEQKGAPLLKDLLEDRTITKIFHFARLDGLFLLLRLGINLQGVYCTKLASRLGRTYTDRHGLKELVREFTGNTMDKSFQTSDWGRAQLSDDQIQYAWSIYSSCGDASTRFSSESSDENWPRSSLIFCQRDESWIGSALTTSLSTDGEL